MPEPDVLLEKKTGGIGVITLNRPEKQNAITTSMCQLLADYVQRLGSDDSIRAIIIAGSRTSFSVGADVTEMIARMPMDPTFELNWQSWRKIDACPKPKIAAIRGLSLGGGSELALLCDIVIAGRNAEFGFPEIDFGIMTGVGGVQRLTRLAGRARSMLWLLTGASMNVETAYEMGMVSEIVDDEDVLFRAEELALEIALKSPLAVSSIINCAKQAENMPLNAGLEMDRQAFKLLLSTEDGREGLSAHVQKREANFIGR